VVQDRDLLEGSRASKGWRVTTRPAAQHSPMTHAILVGQFTIRRVASGAPCPCGGAKGEHAERCPVLAAFAEDEWSRRQADKEIDHG